MTFQEYVLPKLEELRAELDPAIYQVVVSLVGKFPSDSPLPRFYPGGKAISLVWGDSCPAIVLDFLFSGVIEIDQYLTSARRSYILGKFEYEGVISELLEWFKMESKKKQK